MKHNFIELLNAFYDLDIPKCLDPSSSFLFISLLRKFNSTKNKSNSDYFPEFLPIYNAELETLTGMESRSLRNARQRLIDFRLIDDDDDTWILRYQKHGTHVAGIYSMNYELLELFDYGKYGNKFFRNESCVADITEKMVSNLSETFIDIAESQSVTETLVTKNADLPPNSDISLQKGYVSLELNKTKQNKSSSSAIISSNKIDKKSKERSDDCFLDKEFKEFMELDIGIRHKLLESKNLNPEVKKRYELLQETQK